MNDLSTSQPPRRTRQFSLFDSYGLPWTAHLSLGWIIFLILITGGLAAIPVGLCLGVWIKSKTSSMAVLVVYILFAVSCVVLFLADPLTAEWIHDGAGVAAMVLWFAGALIGRNLIIRHYTLREETKFHLSLLFTLLFGVWYLNYRIRPEFPRTAHAESGPGNDL